jgi:hypothetical protein
MSLHRPMSSLSASPIFGPPNVASYENFYLHIQKEKKKVKANLYTTHEQVNKIIYRSSKTTSSTIFQYSTAKHK